MYTRVSIQRFSVSECIREFLYKDLVCQNVYESFYTKI